MGRRRRRRPSRRGLAPGLVGPAHPYLGHRHRPAGAGPGHPGPAGGPPPRRPVCSPWRSTRPGPAATGCWPSAPGPYGELDQARSGLHRAQQVLSDLQAGSGAYRGTEAGRAVSDLVGAQEALSAARWAAEHSSRRRERKAAAKQSAVAAGRLADAERRWQEHVAPEAARLQAVFHERQLAVDTLLAPYERQLGRSTRLAELGSGFGRDARRFAAGLDGYRARLELAKGGAPEHRTGTSYRSSRFQAAHSQPPVGRDAGPGL